MNNTGFLTLIHREFYRFIRLFRQTVAPPVITTFMFILIFGYSLQTRIREIDGFPYIIFIVPGLIQMGVIMNSYANSSTSLFMAKLEKSLENLLVAPLSYFHIVSAYIIGGLLRGLVVGFTILLSAYFLIDLPFYNPWVILFSFIFTSIFFSGLGIISALYAESWDKIGAFTNFVITPFVYLGGVFYSINMLPEPWKTISHFNPIFYSIDLARYGFLGIHDVPVWLSMMVVGSMALFTFGICIYLFVRGYKILK